MLAGCRTGGVLGSEVNPDSFLLSWWGLSHVLFPMWVYCLQPCRVLKFFQNCIKRGTFGSLCSLPTRPNSQHGALTAEPLDTTPTRFGLCWSCGGGVFFGEHQPISIRYTVPSRTVISAKYNSNQFVRSESCLGVEANKPLRPHRSRAVHEEPHE